MKPPFFLASLLLGATLTGCQTGEPAADLNINASGTPVDAIAQVGVAAQKCWFRSGDKAFAAFKLANESNSYVGRPRLLLVPRNKPTGLPSLVIQAERRGSDSTGKFTNVQAYGPLLSTGNGKRIVSDIKRWAKGNPACSALS